MKLLMAGFSPQTAAALEMIAKSLWKDAQFERLDRAAFQQFPVALAMPDKQRHTLVIDLLGLGLARWSPEREAGMLAFVAGRLAIVLLPSDQDDGWQAAAKGHSARPGLLWLRRPLAVGDMRDALTRCGQTVLADPAKPPAAPVATVASPGAKAPAVTPANTEAVTAAVKPPPTASAPTVVPSIPVRSPAPSPTTLRPPAIPPPSLPHSVAPASPAPASALVHLVTVVPGPAGLRLASPVAAPRAAEPQPVPVPAPVPAPVLAPALPPVLRTEPVDQPLPTSEVTPRPPVLSVVPTLPVEALVAAMVPDCDLDAPDSQFAMSLAAEGEWPDLYLPDLECPDPDAPRSPPSWAPPPARVVDAPWALSMLDTAPGMLPLPVDPVMPRVFTASAPSLEVTVPVPPPRPVPVAAPPAAVSPESDEHVPPLRAQPCALTAEACACIKSAYPAVAEVRYLNLILDMSLRAGPTKLSVAQRTVAVFWPQENWVASNITTAFRRRLTQHKLMAQLLSSEEISPGEAFGEATPLFGRRSDGRRPLDGFLWSLAYSTFENAVPVAVADVEFVLNAVPNFTRLPEVPPLFLKLALACLQQPQSVSALMRTFDTENKAMIHLFVLCAMLSGLAVPHRQAVVAQPGSKAEPVVPQARADVPKRGVFRSLLSRLF